MDGDLLLHADVPSAVVSASLHSFDAGAAAAVS